MIKAIRGTRDLLPPETALWNLVEATVRDVFRAYNFHEIRTPIFEDTQLFSRSVGEETDIVAQEMYTWLDPSPEKLFQQYLASTDGRRATGEPLTLELLAGSQSRTLRPAHTASAVRPSIPD